MKEITFTIGDRQYRSRRMSAMKQFHVLRRVAPLMPSFGDVMGAREGAAGEAIKSVMTGFLSALGKLSDADCEYVVQACTAGVSRLEQGGSWANMTTSTGQILFQDVENDLAVLFQIVWEVLQGCLASFFSALPSAPVEEQKDQTSTGSTSPAEKTG